MFCNLAKTILLRNCVICSADYKMLWDGWYFVIFWRLCLGSLCFSLVVTMVMKSAVEDDDAGWGLGIPEKMKNNANWVDITHEFKGACKGTGSALGCLCVGVVCVLLKKELTCSSFSPPLSSSFIHAELNLGELLHDKLWVVQKCFLQTHILKGQFAQFAKKNHFPLTWVSLPAEKIDSKDVNREFSDSLKPVSETS